jgi:hypothetical protein
LLCGQHEPQPKQVTLARGIGVVVEARAPVQHGAVVEEDRLAGSSMNVSWTSSRLATASK